MAYSTATSRPFAGSLLVSGALHAVLFALAVATPVIRGQTRGYEIEIEPEVPYAPSSLDSKEALRSPREDQGAAIGESTVPEPDPATARGPVIGFRPGPSTPTGPTAVAPAAQAGSVLSADGEGAAADFTIVQGNAAKYAGGVTSARGTSDTAVRDPLATGAGMAPANARGPRAGSVTESAPPKPAVARVVGQARAPLPESKSWNCAFPSQADIGQVHYARVTVVVTVSEDGRAKTVAVISDPGHGFGAAARACALRQRYSVARDAHGQATTGTTAPFFVTFTR